MLFKNKIMSTCFGFKDRLLHEITSPAFEKSLSLGTDVAGIPNTSLAINASLGVEGATSFHQASGSSSLSMLGFSM